MLHITVHAQQRMTERGITTRQAVEALRDGQKRPSKYRGHDIWKSTTASTTVVYARQAGSVTILTTY